MISTIIENDMAEVAELKHVGENTRACLESLEKQLNASNKSARQT